MISLILAALVSTAAVDNETPAAAPTPAPVAERKICKTETGSASRLGSKRICRTPAEWKAVQDATTRDLDKRERQ
ncbi:hypothetical protein [Sphingomonas koreensis]